MSSTPGGACCNGCPRSGVDECGERGGEGGPRPRGSGCDDVGMPGVRVRLARTQRVEQGPRFGRADAVVQAQQAKPGDLVDAVVEQSHAGNEVLDVRSLEELQPAEFDERHATGGELDLEQIAVVRGAHQHGLVVERAALLGCIEDAVDDHAGFGGGVVAAHQSRPTATASIGAKLQLELAGARPDRIGQLENRLPGTEILLQAHRPRCRQLTAQRQQMAAVGPAEGIDRLCVVADHRQPVAIRAQQPHDVDLDLVDVLVLVDQHVIEASGDRRSQCGVGQKRPPAQ